MADKYKLTQLKRFESTDSLYEARQDAVEVIINYLERHLVDSPEQLKDSIDVKVAREVYPKIRNLLFHAPATLNALRLAINSIDLPATQIFILDYKRYLRSVAEAAEENGYKKTRKRGKPKDGDEPLIY